jgi:isopentenyldiphosphate isomerase
MKDELLDLVNEKDEIIGSVWKSEAHKNPKLIHREVGIVIFNDKGETLLQQRSMHKKVNPGEWKVAAAGHIGSGENPTDAIEREVREELGIEISPIFFEKSVITSIGQESHLTYIYYALVTDHPNIVFAEKEVMSTEWVKLTQLVEFSKTHDYNLESLSYRMTIKIAQKQGLL